MRLPSAETVKYANGLVVAIVGALLMVYLLARFVVDPGALVRAARKQTGA